STRWRSGIRRSSRRRYGVRRRTSRSLPATFSASECAGRLSRAGDGGGGAELSEAGAWRAVLRRYGRRWGARGSDAAVGCGSGVEDVAERGGVGRGGVEEGVFGGARVKEG